MGDFDFLKAVSLNAVLYYADYLSLYHTYTPITDTCKYFIIYGTPVNAAYLGVIPQCMTRTIYIINRR